MSIIMANVEAEAIARNYIETIDDVAQEAHIVGSIRRLKPTTKDIDLVVLPKSYNELWARLDKQAQDGIIQKGDSWGKTYRNFTYNAANIELYTCTPTKSRIHPLASYRISRPNPIHHDQTQTTSIHRPLSSWLSMACRLQHSPPQL